MGKHNKAKCWDDVDDDIKNKIVELRAKERKLLEESGYVKWKKLFLGSYISYALAFFIYIKFINKAKVSDLNFKHIFALCFPSFFFGVVLQKMYFDKNKYQEYYQTHLELNRVIKKTAKSQEYR